MAWPRALRRGSSRVRVGWVAATTLDARLPSFRRLEAAVAMRIANNARGVMRLDPRIACEMYRSARRYDIVVFFKAMDESCQAEAARIQGYGGRVIFDANVNYYDIAGEYDIADTRPTPVQQRDAIAMTAAADHVVADSTNLLAVVQRHNASATWIPDNVDLERWVDPVRHRERERVRLVWSGIAKKAQPLLGIREALAQVPGCELVLVSNERPAALDGLAEALPCSYQPFTMRGYGRILRTCDVIISPKNLVNAYELGHTEWKITLGMAAGLPAVASPQRSYVEAIGHCGGGFIADTGAEWARALGALAGDVALRGDLGAKARQTVEEVYATPVVARRYLDVLRSLA